VTLTSPTPVLRWSKVTDSLTTGEFNGNHAGIVEHVGSRFVATDAFGWVVGRFATEDEARAALLPEALDRAWDAREQRERRIAGITAVLAAGSSILAAVGIITIAGM